MENATRFISAYNKIDNLLRSRYDFKPNVSFSEVVRRSATYSAVVRKYEDDLESYARLRNVIVHNSNDRMIIAEPHDDIVANIERICEILLSPPLALSCAHKALTLPHTTPLVQAIKTMTKSGYSNVPVLQDGKIIGVATNKLIVEFIARKIGSADLDEALEAATVSDVLKAESEHYEILSSTVTADEVVGDFYKNPKLQIVILADEENIEGVITTGDLNKILKILL